MLSCCLGWFDIFLGQNWICLLNENSVKKDVIHHLQWYGVTLVWISICLLRCVLLDKDLSHLEHWYGPEWILSIWFSRKIFFEYDLSHLEHENDSDSSGQLIIGAVYLDSKQSLHQTVIFTLYKHFIRCRPFPLNISSILNTPNKHQLRPVEASCGQFGPAKASWCQKKFTHCLPLPRWPSC